MRSLFKTAVLTLCLAGCERPELPEPDPQSLTIVTTLPEGSGNIEVAYAIPIDEFNKAFSAVCELVTTAEQGAQLKYDIESVAEQRAAALRRLRSIQLNSNIEPTVRSSYASVLLSATAVEPIDISVHDLRLSSCMERHTKVQAACAQEDFNPTKTQRVNTAIRWMMEELLRQARHNPGAPIEDRPSQGLFVETEGVIKGISRSAGKVSFMLPSPDKYFIFFSTNSGLSLQLVDPTLNPALQVETFDRLSSSYFSTGEWIAAAFEMDEVDSVKKVRELLKERRNYWASLAAAANPILADLTESANVRTRIEELEQQRAALTSQIEAVESQVSKLAETIETLEKVD